MIPTTAIQEPDLDMRASRERRSPHATPALRALPLAALAGLACAGTPPAPDPSVLASAPPPPSGALRVRLLFGAEADLDLYVSGPALETVYFANETSRDGGRLERDRRCGDPAPRVETVVFEDAAPGAYRVGVDFMVRCDGADEAPYTIILEAPGRAPLEHSGVARFGAFDERAVEWRLDPAR